MNWILIASGFLGFSAVALGAYGDHGLRDTIDEDAMHSFETALRYQLFHAIALLSVGIGLTKALNTTIQKQLFWAGIVMLTGTVVFSGSIYASVLLDIKSITMLTPLGGITLMVSWLILGWTGLTEKNRDLN